MLGWKSFRAIRPEAGEATMKTEATTLMPDQPVTQAPISSAPSSLFDLNIKNTSLFVLAMLILYSAFRSICQAATKPFWYDEICTFMMVRQHRISVLWSALRDGADGQPPGFYLAERLPTALIANENISFRILSIFGFLFTVLCLFFLIKKRRGSAVAVLCAAIPLITVLYDIFAVESRPYSLVVACISFALICYQKAPSGRWIILMGMSLALAQSFHYFAFFAFLPFLISEAVLLIAERQVRWAVWLAFGCGFLPLVAFWPLLSRSRVIYGEHFWSLPSLQMAEASYGWYLRTSLPTGMGLTAASAVAVLGTLLYRIRRGGLQESKGSVSLQEPLMILSFLSLPFVAIAATKLAHSGMTSKYVLSTVLGFPLAVSYALPRSGRKGMALVFSIFLLLLSSQEILFWSSYHGHFPSPADAVEDFVDSAGHGNLPVVVSDVQEFMPLAHYASPEWKKRFVSVVDPSQAVVYTGSDTGDKELPILASYFPLNVYEFHTFAAEHPTFLLYSSHGGLDGDWWPRKLQQDGYTLRPVAVKPRAEHDFFHRVFLVSRTEDAD